MTSHSRSPRIIAATIASVATALTLGACTDNPQNSSSDDNTKADQTIQVTITDDSCELSTSEVPSGVVKFEITNNAVSYTHLTLPTNREV